jgi:AraC family transcriptional regulator
MLVSGAKLNGFASVLAQLSPVEVATRHVADFLLREMEYPAGLTLVPRSPETACLIYAIEGAYTETHDGGRTIKCSPGVLRYLPAGMERGYVFEEDARCLIVSIGAETVQRVGAHSSVLAQPGEIRGGAAQWQAQRLYTEFKRADELSALSIEGILLQILADGIRNSWAPDPTSLPRWLRVAREYAESNFAQSISLDEIAAAAGVHRVHLARGFRRHFSMTVGQFLRMRRVEHACQLLRTKQAALADIAIGCGFSDQSHFGSTFRRYLGMTPGRFRELAR